MGWKSIQKKAVLVSGKLALSDRRKSFYSISEIKLVNYGDMIRFRHQNLMDKDMAVSILTCIAQLSILISYSPMSKISTVAPLPHRLSLVNKTTI